MVSRLAWSSGSLLVAASVGEQAYIAHASNELKTDANKRLPLQNAALIQMLNGLGLMMLSLRVGKKTPKMAYAPLGLLILGSTMFSGFIFYDKLTGDGRLRSYVRYGGSATIFGWLAMTFL